MRISSTMMSNNYLKQLNGTYEQYTKLFEQSDGKKLHRASDNSVGYSKYLRYQNSLGNNEQFSSDVNTAISWMKNSDAVLLNVADQMKEFKGKMVQAGNSTNNESDMKDISKELLARVQEIVADMNSQIGDRYLFSGQSDTTMPFSISDSLEERGETKTLSEAQASFFNIDYSGGDTPTVTQMLKMHDANENVYYLDVTTGYVFTEDFVENGYKDKAREGRTVAPGDAADSLASWGGSTDVRNYFDENGIITGDGRSFSGDITVGGETVTLKFSTVEQYVVKYNGDAKYISMVKKTGGVDQATDTVNQTGQDVFGSDIFDTPGLSSTSDRYSSGTAMLNELLYAVAKVEAADYYWSANDGLTLSDEAHAQVLGAETTLAARQQAYTAAQDMLTTQNESIVSDITDVSSTDVALLATKLMEYQTIYSLSLSVGSKILPGTLADYL